MTDAVNVNIACLSRARTGPCAYGLCLTNPQGDVLLEKHALLPDGTPMHGSYLALVAGLEEAVRLGAHRVSVYADSDLVVNQMRGRGTIKEDALRALHDRACLMAARLNFSIIHVARDRNAIAHRLAERALADVPMPVLEAAIPQRPLELIPRKTGVQQSAGGMVYKLDGTVLSICLIAKGRVWALPKGRINEGETPDQTASREILEETGHLARVEYRLHDIEYWFYWKENNTLYHKTVTFYLMPLVAENHAAPDGEADEVAWFTVADAWQKLTYPNERDVLRKGQAYLKRTDAP